MTTFGGKVSDEKRAESRRFLEESARMTKEAKAGQHKERQAARARAKERDRYAVSAAGLGYNKADVRNMSRDEKANMHADVTRARREQGEARMQATRERNAREKQHKATAAQWGIDTSKGMSAKALRYINEGGDQMDGGHYQRRAIDNLRHQQSRREADDRMNAANIADPDKNVTSEDYAQYKAGKAHWQDSAVNAYQNYANNMRPGGGKRNSSGEYYNPYTNSYGSSGGSNQNPQNNQQPYQGQKSYGDKQTKFSSW